MKGLVVVNGFSYSLAQVYKIRRLTEEFAKVDVQIEEKSTLDLTSFFVDGTVWVPGIADYGFVVFLDKDRYLAAALEEYLPLFNSARAIEICDDKMETFLFLKNRGLKTPKTMPAPLCYDPHPDPSYIRQLVKNVENEFSYPLIVKQCYGSLGRQVRLAHDRQELLNLMTELIHLPHVYQEYVASSCGRDVRMFTVGGKVVAAMERINEKDFRSNVALGGHGVKIDPSPAFVEMAETVSEAIGLAYAGIDLMFGPKGEPVLAEVNSNAFFTEIEKVSGVNVTRLLVEYILKQLKN